MLELLLRVKKIIPCGSLMHEMENWESENSVVTLKVVS